MMENCPCCSNLVYDKCCEPYHKNQADAKTPEVLMRSRYAAYALHLTDYLIKTTHSSTRHLYQKSDIESWAKTNKWLKLEIILAVGAKVEFKAYYKSGSKTYVHHENSTFKKEHNRWYYLKGDYPN